MIKKSWHEPFNVIMTLKEMYEIHICNSADIGYNIHQMVQELQDYRSVNAIECISTMSKQELEDLEFIEKFISQLKINQYKEFTLLKYGEMSFEEGFFDQLDGILKECRSCTIDMKKEKIVTAAMRKFHNMNEIKETSEKNVRNFLSDRNNHLETSDKLDGSLQMARWYNDDIFLTGSSAIHKSQSWRIEEGLKLVTLNVRRMLKENIGFTFIFELIHFKDAHIIHYPVSMNGLYLIGVRDVDTGKELRYEDIEQIAKYYHVRSTTVYNNLDLDEMLELCKSSDGSKKEGWVINVCRDKDIVLKVKLKVDEYRKLHRTLGSNSSPNATLEAIADGCYDDFFAKIPQTVQDISKEYAKEIFEFFKIWDNTINYYVEQCPKDIGLMEKNLYANKLPKIIRGHVRYKLIGKKQKLKTILHKTQGYVSYTKMKTMTQQLINLNVKK